MRLGDLHVPAAWSGAADRLLAAGGPVLVYGRVDSGKSVLCRYLLSRFIARAGATALLDGDVGMAMVGTPGLIGLTLVLDVDSLDGREVPDRAWFVGSTTPVGQLLPMVQGLQRLADIARAEGVPLVVNTCGLVSGAAGKELQLAVADAVRPAAAVGLQSARELEHLLVPLERQGLQVERLAPSPRARVKPRAERASQRAERFASYFARAESRSLPLAQVCLEGSLFGSGFALSESLRADAERYLDTHVIDAEEAGDAVSLIVASTPHDEGAALAERALGGRRLHVLEAHELAGCLVGLLAPDGECLGLGLLDAWTGDGVLEVWSPAEDKAWKQVRRLRLGSLRLAHSGEELGWAARERTLSGPAA